MNELNRAWKERIRYTRPGAIDDIFGQLGNRIDLSVLLGLVSHSRLDRGNAHALGVVSK